MTEYRHDRSCLEMPEADGVDSGAICKRGFIHLQFAEKPEAPEAERHLVKSRATVSPWVSRSSNLHAVGPGSEVLVICRNLIGCKYHLANGCVLYDFSKIFSIQFQLNIERRAFYIVSNIFSVLGNKYSRLIILTSFGWDLRVGLVGVGFCAGFPLSVSKNRARFSYPGFDQV
ncbi:hypothetical protein V1477_009494 [Vespula maculifrons]|uniref:Uncharacterized protein n=1 Tax=Vespula maculifrons TaxID=7453 RepID=A0ABD2CAN2_VESMC